MAQPTTDCPQVEPIRCRAAAGPADLEAHLAVRRRVFVEEQGLFDGSDRDERDDRPGTVHLLAALGGTVCGAVRLYPLADDEARRFDLAGRRGPWRGTVWQGDRLAVLPEFRRDNVGTPLVRLAVASAAAAGGGLMVARIQVRNVRFFERLGWHVVGGASPYVGLLHQTMLIGLAAPGR